MYVNAVAGGMTMKKRSIMKTEEVLNRLYKLEMEIELLEKKLGKAVNEERREIVEERNNRIEKLESDFGKSLEKYSQTNISCKRADNFYRKKVV